MQNVNHEHFLNRLALDHGTSPYDVNLDDVLRDLRRFATPAEWQELFRNYCAAALSSAYNWHEGTPGNLVHFGELLEVLIEICYLRKQSPFDGSARISWTLPEWKHHLHQWTEAALSAFSVAENISPEQLIPFVEGMERMIKDLIP